MSHQEKITINGVQTPVRYIPSIPDNVFETFVPKWKSTKTAFAILKYFGHKGGGYQRAFVSFLDAFQLFPDCEMIMLISGEDAKYPELIEKMREGNTDSFVLIDEMGRYDGYFNATDFCSRIDEDETLMESLDKIQFINPICFTGELPLIGKAAVELVYDQFIKKLQDTMLSPLKEAEPTRFDTWIPMSNTTSFSSREEQRTTERIKRYDIANSLGMGVVELPPLFEISEKKAAELVENIEISDTAPPLDNEHIEKILRIIGTSEHLPIKGTVELDAYAPVFIKAKDTVNAIIEIWKSRVKTLPFGFMPIPDREYDWNAIVDVGKAIGVESNLEAYAAGVPLEDILA